MGVGEYAGGYGFPLPKLVAMLHPRISAVTASGSVGAWMLQKKKLLGVVCSGIAMPNTIQLRELAHMRLKGWWCGWHATHSADADGNPNMFNVERDEEGLWLNEN